MSGSHRQENVEPVMATLAEALADSDPQSTLFWGRGMGAMALESASKMEVELLESDIASCFHGSLSCSVAAQPDAQRRYDRIICRLPRSKAELNWRVQVAASRIQSQGTVWLVGHTQEGIKSASAALQASVGPVTLLRNKRRVRVLGAVRQTDAVGAAPVEDDFMSCFEVDFGGILLLGSI